MWFSLLYFIDLSKRGFHLNKVSSSVSTIHLIWLNFRLRLISFIILWKIASVFEQCPLSVFSTSVLIVGIDESMQNKSIYCLSVGHHCEWNTVDIAIVSDEFDLACPRLLDDWNAIYMIAGPCFDRKQNVINWRRGFLITKQIQIITLYLAWINKICWFI